MQERKEKIDYIWHRIKMGQTLNSIAKRNGIESWEVLYEHNRDLLKNPNILNYIDEDIYDIGWCINNKNGVLRIPILNSQDQEEITAEQLCEDNRRRMEKLINKEMDERVFVRKVKDTPEETEDWEKRFIRTFGYWGEEIKFIKQLLEDREREAYHDGYTDGVTRCMDSLNKLEEDKNEGA